MSEVNQRPLSQARTIRNAIVTAVNSKGRENVAKLLDCDVSYVAKLINDDSDQKLKFKNIGRLLEFLGLKIVPVNARCVVPEKFELLQKLAAIGAKHIASDDMFGMGEPEDAV